VDGVVAEDVKGDAGVGAPLNPSIPQDEREGAPDERDGAPQSALPATGGTGNSGLSSLALFLFGGTVALLGTGMRYIARRCWRSQ